MGYVFDAMTRGGNARRPRRGGPTAATPSAAPIGDAAPSPAPLADTQASSLSAQTVQPEVQTTKLQTPPPQLQQRPEQDIERLIDQVQQQVTNLSEQAVELAAAQESPAALPDEPSALRSEPETRLPDPPAPLPIIPPKLDLPPRARQATPVASPAASTPVPDPGPALAESAAPTAPQTLQAIEAAATAPRPQSARPARDPHITIQTDLSAIDDRLVAIGKPASVVAEEYRAVRTGLLARWEQRRHLVHTITSATPQEGKTVTSLNLGLSFAELHNRRTVVVEADLRLPQFSKLLGLAECPGLLGYLENRADLRQIIQGVGENGLHVIQAGGRANDRSVQLLSSREMATLLTELRRQYDHVIIDTPPVVELADAGILGGRSDEVLLVVRMNVTPHPLVEQAIRTLSHYKTPVAGIIATAHRRGLRRYYYRNGYGYHYRYYDSKDQ